MRYFGWKGGQHGFLSGGTFKFGRRRLGEVNYVPVDRLKPPLTDASVDIILIIIFSSLAVIARRYIKIDGVLLTVL